MLSHYPSDPMFWIAYSIAILFFILPVFIGIPMCLKNKQLPWYMKLGWLISYLFFEMFAFFIYLAIYSHRRDKQE